MCPVPRRETFPGRWELIGKWPTSLCRYLPRRLDKRGVTMFVGPLETAILGGLFKKHSEANGRKGQRQQLRDDKGRMNGGLGLREHLHGDWPPTSNPSISSLTTCPTPDESIFNEGHDHSFYATTQNVIMLVESDVERYSVIRSLVLHTAYDLDAKNKINKVRVRSTSEYM
jgi:hypothetical protein